MFNDEPKKEKKKFNKGAFFYALAIIVVAGCYFIFGYTVSQNEMIADATPFNYDTSGGVTDTGSMSPCISYGDTMYYEREFDLNIGDVYVFNNSKRNGTILHRLMYIDGDWCFFKGDHNTVMDEKINCSNVLLRLIGVEFK